MTELWFEDIEVGYQERSGEHTADRAEMLAYAKANDPWPIHTGENTSGDGPFGGIVASFGYTVSLIFRANHELKMNANNQSAFLGALGWNVGFKGAVYPGDRLHLEATITEKRRSRSKPDRGIVIGHFDLVNQHGDVVITLDVTSLVACRPT